MELKWKKRAGGKEMGSRSNDKISTIVSYLVLRVVTGIELEKPLNALILDKIMLSVYNSTISTNVIKLKPIKLRSYFPRMYRNF